MLTVIFPLINLPHSPLSLSLFMSLSLSPPFLSPDQEASPRLPARLAAAGNAAVRVALAAQKGKEGESGEGEERQRAGAQEEQSQEDEVNKLTRGGGINGNRILQGCMNKHEELWMLFMLPPDVRLMCCHIS